MQQPIIVLPILAWPAKDPDEVLDYQVNWTAKLAGDAISTSVFTVVSPDALLVINSQGNSTTTTTVWLSGGRRGATYKILNKIVTLAGRTFDQTVALPIVSK